MARLKPPTILTVDEPGELLAFLLRRLPARGRNALKGLLARRQVSVNGIVASRFDHPVKPGQSVAIGGAREALRGLRIVFEDSCLIVIEKEAGFLSVATPAEREATCYRVLDEHVKKREPGRRVFVLHRLDRDTSGLMMYAKSLEIQRALQERWSESVTARTYVALVEGRLEREEGSVTSRLKENGALAMYSTRRAEGGREAKTRYRVLERSSGYTLVECELETGRKNQIRVHMRDLGHCVVGDRKYGSTVDPIGRLGLHACRLGFRHPETGEEMLFESPIPAEFLRPFKPRSAPPSAS